MRKAKSNWGLLKYVVVLATFAMFQQNAQADNYTAVGILVTQNKELDYFKTEFVKLEGFKNLDDCEKAVKSESHSKDYIGEGGTNNNVPAVQWNFDANCKLINREP